MAKLWCVLQVLHCARVHIQRFHRLFATFVWGSLWEPMRREYFFLPAREAGINLPHLFVRLLVSRFMLLRTCSHPFLQTLCQVLLQSELPYIIVSSVTFPTLRVWSFLKEVVNSANFLHARFLLECLFSVSRCVVNRNLIDSHFPAPLYRRLLSGMPRSDVLTRVKRMPVSPSPKSFFFQLHTSTLLVKLWLRDRGIFVSVH